MRVSNADKNVQVLEGVPFVEREDLAITFHIAVEETEAGRASAIVTNRMMETYGVTRNQLYEDALANSPVIAPVKINNLGELLGDVYKRQYSLSSDLIPDCEIRRLDLCRCRGGD